MWAGRGDKIGKKEIKWIRENSILIQTASLVSVNILGKAFWARAILKFVEILDIEVKMHDTLYIETTEFWVHRVMIHRSCDVGILCAWIISPKYWISQQQVPVIVPNAAFQTRLSVASKMAEFDVKEDIISTLLFLHKRKSGDTSLFVRIFQ